MQMESVYGRKRSESKTELHETWMDHFTRSEPEGGFRAAVQWAWKATAPKSAEHPETLAA